LHRGSAITFVNYMHPVVCVVIYLSLQGVKETSSHGFDLKFHGLNATFIPLILTRRQVLLLKR
jgi:hypothetical protein